MKEKTINEQRAEMGLPPINEDLIVENKIDPTKVQINEGEGGHQHGEIKH